MENKETLEEAIGRYPRYIENPPNINAIFKWEIDKYFEIKQQCFIHGAEWQAERMYSEEDMILFSEWVSRNYENQTKYIRNRDMRRDTRGFYSTKELFQQFKKNKDGK